ncbi:Retrovirus-related Pol polyprotein from transposon 17.6, partial [Stegodyphus mimosarum]
AVDVNHYGREPLLAFYKERKKGRFYRRFIQNFAHKALPLTELTKDKVTFKWTDEAQQAFDNLKAELLTQPILALPDFTKPFALCTDASNYALGAILGQEDENKFLHPICFASRKLKGPEINYSTVEKEALAVVWATAHFRQYLLGKSFTVYCDQASLSHVLKLKDPTSRIARWIMGLSQYDYKIVHKPFCCWSF